MNEQELKDLLRQWEKVRQANEKLSRSADTELQRNYYKGLRDARLDCLVELTLAWAGAES